MIVYQALLHYQMGKELALDKQSQWKLHLDYQNYYQMNAKTQLSNCPSPRKFYIKRKQLKEQSFNDNSSIFASLHNKAFESYALIDDLKKYQTVTTAIDNTITLQSNNQETIEDMEKSNRLQKSDFLPKLNLVLESKLSRTNNEAKSVQLKTKQKSMSFNHVSDPHYLKLDKNMPKRVNNAFNKYKRGWADFCQRRKEKSVIQRSLARAAESIQHINLDAGRRKNTTDLSEMLRNNIAEKTFIFPGKIKPEIQGLKGKGGKCVPLFSEVYVVEEVYKHHKGNEISN